VQNCVSSASPGFWGLFTSVMVRDPQSTAAIDFPMFEHEGKEYIHLFAEVFKRNTMATGLWFQWSSFHEQATESKEVGSTFPMYTPKSLVPFSRLC
jgi:hypothetical protein